MAGNSKDQQSSGPSETEPEETAAAQQSASPPVPEKEPDRAQASAEEIRKVLKKALAGNKEDTDDGAPKQDIKSLIEESEAGKPVPDTEPASQVQTGDEAEPLPADAVQSKSAAAEDAATVRDDPAGAAGENNEPEDEDSDAASEEERRRVIEMTRTVQLSLEQITAAMADIDPNAASPEDGERGDADTGPAAEYEDEEPSGEDTAHAQEYAAEKRSRQRDREPSLGRRIGRAAGSGLLSIIRWLLLVLFFVALIAAVGIAFLYRSATADLIPKVAVTLGGQAVQPTAYDWNVPVVNHLFSRRYHETLSEEPVALEQAVEGIRPELAVTPQEFETRLVLKDDSGNELFSGSVFTFGEYTFEKDGTYAMQMTVTNHANRFDVNAVEGSQSYDFTFDITLHPSVRLDSSSVLQGDIVAVVASGIPMSDKPTLDCGFDNPGFVPAKDGWIAYVPIPIDAEPGEYSFAVHSISHEQTLTLKVHERAWRELPLKEEDELHWAYVGPDNTPPEVEQVLRQNEDTIYWHDEGFAMPYDLEVTPDLEFGTTEIVNDGIGTVRRSINTVATLPTAWYGSELVAPAAGRVVLAEDLGGEYSAEHDILLPNKTLVIDHGGGIKTVYYNLRSIDAAVGDIVEQGQKIGTSQLTICIGAYVGDVPVDSTMLWQGKCNAVKYY